MIVALASVAVTAQRTRGAADAELSEAVSFVAAAAPATSAGVGASEIVDPQVAAQGRDLVRRLDDRLDREGLGAGVLSAAIALAIALVVATMVVRPLHGLTALARRLASGEREPEPDVERRRGNRETRDMRWALAQLSTELRTREEAQRAAVARVSHESRNALGGILVRIEGLRDGVLIDRAGTLELIEQEALRVLRQVEDLDRLAGLRAERVDACSAVDLAGAVRAAVRRQTPAARARRVEIKCWAGAFAGVDGDREHVARVVDNLLSNALRYTDPGGYVFVRISADAHRVRLEVADSGIGMTDEEIAHIFDAFWRGAGGHRRAPDGSGVGLAVVRHSVAALGGTIEVTSRVGIGSCFRVDLPAPAVPAIAAHAGALRVA
jgi:signal transduction histidine kinase